MEIDQPGVAGSADNGDALRQKLAVAERALLGCSGEGALARRSTKCALRKLCQDRNLDDGGRKIDLASRLIDWVSDIPPTIHELNLTCVAKPPPTP